MNSLFYDLTHWFCSQYLQSWFCCSKTIRSLWICCLLRINYMLTHSQCYFSSLCFFKLYQLALRQGYSLHLSQFSSVKITDITNVDQFMACFFPEGLDTDQNTFAMKVRYTSLCDCVCPVYLCLKCCVITVSRICFVVLCYKESLLHWLRSLTFRDIFVKNLLLFCMYPCVCACVSVLYMCVFVSVCVQVRAMQGCALCIFELERQHSFLSQKGLCKLLRVLNFMRTMMQAFQQHEHLYWQIYNGILEELV